VGEIFIWLSGASRSILAECPTERPKYFGIGAAIFITGAMAGVSAAFALVNALKVLLAGAIIFGVFWGLAIMMIDRLFVVTMRRPSSRLFAVLQATPRVIMAIVIGFVISTPFVLQLFKPEITAEMKKMQAAQREAYYAAPNPIQNAIDKDQLKYDNLKEMAAAGGTPAVVSNDPQIKAWTNQLNQAINEVQIYTNELDCQLHGGTIDGVKCQPGYGPLGQDDQAKLSYWQGRVNALTQEIGGRTRELESQGSADQKAQEQAAAGQLASVKAQIDAETAELAAQTQSITSSINGDNGILEQLKALGAVTAGNSTLQLARILLFLIFLFVDIMPVFVKLMMNLSKEPSAYDRILADEEKMQIQAAENSRAVRLVAHRQAAQAEANGLRYWNEVLRAEPEGSRKELNAMRQRLEEARRKRYEQERMRDLAKGEGFIGVGLHPDPDARVAPLPGRPLGGGYRAWPPRGRASANGKQHAGGTGQPQADPSEDQAADGAMEAAVGVPNGGQPATAAGDRGPGAWTGQQPDPQPQAGQEQPQAGQEQPQAGQEQPRAEHDGPGQPPEPAWRNPLPAWLRSIRLPRLSFLGRRGREEGPAAQPTAPTAYPSVRLLGQEEVTADTQPQYPPPSGPAALGSGQVTQAWQEPAQPDSAFPQFPWRDLGKTVEEPLPGDGQETRPERFGDAEETDWGR
jgi:hypothetical protein